MSCEGHSSVWVLALNEVLHSIPINTTRERKAGREEEQKTGDTNIKVGTNGLELCYIILTR